MKRTLVVGLLGLLLASVSVWSQRAAVNEASGDDASQVFLAMTGGSVWTSGSTGTCVMYFPILGNLPLTSLFASGPGGSPVVDKEHAYFIWVSDWSIEAMFQNQGFGGSVISLARVPAGTATIYYTDNPLSRDWSDLSQRSTWGVPIATLVRGGGLFQSSDSFANDRFSYSARILTAREISLQGRPFNLRSLMPHGMSCWEYGQMASTTETASCIKMGD